jgi:hypothetical protein
MGRRYMCEVCSEAIEDGYTGANFEAAVSFPPREGKPQPTIKVKVDVCSGPCLIRYVTEKLLPEIARGDAKWRTYGTSSVAPPGQPLNLRFNAATTPEARRLKR